MSKSPPIEDLKFVAEHGQSQLIRSLATVQLAKRLDKEEELASLIDQEQARNRNSGK